jgi:hypothetical protein
MNQVREHVLSVENAATLVVARSVDSCIKDKDDARYLPENDENNQWPIARMLLVQGNEVDGDVKCRRGAATKGVDVSSIDLELLFQFGSMEKAILAKRMTAFLLKNDEGDATWHKEFERVDAVSLMSLEEPAGSKTFAVAADQSIGEGSRAALLLAAEPLLAPAAPVDAAALKVELDAVLANAEKVLADFEKSMSASLPPIFDGLVNVVKDTLDAPALQRLEEEVGEAGTNVFEGLLDVIQEHDAKVIAEKKATPAKLTGAQLLQYMNMRRARM